MIKGIMMMILTTEVINRATEVVDASIMILEAIEVATIEVIEVATIVAIEVATIEAITQADITIRETTIEEGEFFAY
jgi:hypothetical protein